MQYSRGVLGERLGHGAETRGVLLVLVVRDDG